MYVGPWQEYKLFQLMSMKDKHREKPPNRGSSNDSKVSDAKSSSTRSIAESTHSILANNATNILKGYYNQWKDYETQSSFAQHIDSKY